MLFVRWSAENRILPSAEVDGLFRQLADRILLFAFETNGMQVESHRGQLSLKMVVRGEEQYHVAGRTVALAPGRVLLLNAGEQYASSIDHRGTRSVSFFVPARDVADALAAMTMTDGALLDDPSRPSAPEVTQAPFRATGALAALTQRLATATFSAAPPDRGALEGLVVETAVAALAADLNLVRRGGLAHCVRRSTRAELAARVIRACELIEDSRGRVSLTEMASVACLSRYHFLRVFREVTGVTPAAWARRVRLRNGLAELRRTGSARRAARVAGFSSVSTFLRATRRAPDW
jgi:AraC-like DNA-binding protein